MTKTILNDFTMIILLFLGLFLSIKFRFFQITKVGFIFKNTVVTLLKKDKKNIQGISSFQAVTTALAGTMGVGNIAGVATAIVAGGPGAVFWMWISAFWGMATKYAEIFLAVKYRNTDKTGNFAAGPMYYIKNKLKINWLAVVFSVLCVFASFGIGNMAQVKSVTSAINHVFSINEVISGIIVAGIVIMIIFGGVKRISQITEMVIPFISVIYICFSVVFLYINRNFICQTFSLIINSALGLDKAVSGIMGYSVSGAVKLGLSRGVFTNEAGLGSAPIVHGAANTKSPAHQGVWGVFEVFLDTIVVCTVTALVILTANHGMLWQSGLDGSVLTSAAFKSIFNQTGEKFISLSIIFFAIPSMLGWCYYGESALKFLINKEKAINIYRFIFCCCIAISPIIDTKSIWTISDILNSLMALPNIIAIFLLRNLIYAPTERKKT